MNVKYNNNASTTLVGDILLGATSFIVASSATLPVLGVGDYTYLTIDQEVVKVTDITGTTCTCDPTASGHSNGDTVELRMTTELLDAVKIEASNNKNLLIDPNFAINQEGYVDNTDLAVGDYCYDMWKSFNALTSNGVSVSSETITLEQNAQLEQINDDLIANSGKTVTISIASGSLEVSGGGITGTQTIDASTSHTFTLAVTSSDGIVIEYSSTSTGAFSGLKLELGSIATTYEIPHVTKEELKCYRYYERIGGRINDWHPIANGLGETTTIAYGTLFYREKRIVPTVTPGASVLSVGNAASQYSATFSASNISPNTALWKGTLGVANLAIGDAYILWSGNTSQYIEVDARY